MVDDPVEPGLVEFSCELFELVLFDLLFLSLDELLDELEFIVELGDEELGLVVSEGVLLPGVDDVLLPGDDVLGEDVPGDDELDPGVAGEVVCAIRTPPPRKAPRAGTSKIASCFFIDLGSFFESRLLAYAPP